MATTTTTQTIRAVGLEEQPIISFHFIKDLPQYENEKPFEIWRETEPGVPKSNCEFHEVGGIELHNMRTAATRFGYETTGFKFLDSSFAADLRGTDCVENEDSPRLNAYLEDCIALAKSEFGSKEVICFDWRVSLHDGATRIPETDRKHSIASRLARSRLMCMIIANLREVMP